MEVDSVLLMCGREESLLGFLWFCSRWYGFEYGEVIFIYTSFLFCFLRLVDVIVFYFVFVLFFKVKVFVRNFVVFLG